MTSQIAYLTKTFRGFDLVICDRPCNGEEYQNALRVFVADKRTARAYCKARDITPWNF